MTAAMVFFGFVLASNAQAQTALQAAHAPNSNLQFILGLQGPEDLVQIPGSDWIIVSSFAALTTPKTFYGGLGLIDPITRTLVKVKINATDVARAPYIGCVTPPDPSRFSAHGLSIRRDSDGKSTLFVVGHLGREAIEVFDVTVTAGKPALTWIGCVPGIAGAFNNSVVGLTDGSILVTDFLHEPATFADLFANRKTGAVYRWTPGGAFEKLLGTDLSGPNGIEVTPDGHYMFVADSGSATVFRYDLKALDKPPLEIKPGFRTDNIRWSPERQLLLAGAKTDPSCQPVTPKCPKILIVKTLDPDTLKMTSVLEMPATTDFSNLSSALLVNGILWLGTPEGDRIAYKELQR